MPEVFTFESWLPRTSRLLVQRFLWCWIKARYIWYNGFLVCLVHGNIFEEKNMSSLELLVIDDVAVNDFNLHIWVYLFEVTHLLICHSNGRAVVMETDLRFLFTFGIWRTMRPMSFECWLFVISKFLIQLLDGIAAHCVDKQIQFKVAAKNITVCTLKVLF